MCRHNRHKIKSSYFYKIDIPFPISVIIDPGNINMHDLWYQYSINGIIL